MARSLQRRGVGFALESSGGLAGIDVARALTAGKTSRHKWSLTRSYRWPILSIVDSNVKSQSRRRFSAGYPRNARPENAQPRAEPRVGNRATHPAGVERRT